MTPRRVLVAALIAWSAAIVAALVVGAPLHGDEAAYAVLARTGSDDWLYRSRGVVALARVGIALGGSDLAMRAANAVLGLAVVIAAGAVGRAVVIARQRSGSGSGSGSDGSARADRVGAWTAAAIAGSHPFVLRGAELLGDVPAAAALLAAIAVLLGELSRAEGPRYRLVAVAPLVAATFYLRYGHVLAIAGVAVASLVVWWRPIARRPGPVVATVVVAALLALPFLAMSEAATGSPIAILTIGSTVAGRAESYPGAGLVEYATSNPFVMYGLVTFPLAVVGLACVARSRAHAYLGAIAALQLGTIGVVAHAEPRYVLVAVALLVALGVDALEPAVARRGASAAASVAALAALAAASCVVMMSIAQSRVPRDAATNGAAIRADAAGQPCAVYSIAVPQLAWYSGCAGEKWLPPAAPPPLPPAARAYAADAPGFAPIDAAALGRTLGATPEPLAPGVWRLLR